MDNKPIQQPLKPIIMKNAARILLFLLAVITMTACERQDTVEDSSQRDLEYKEKLNNVVHFKKVKNQDSAKSKNPEMLHFKSYEEAYKYFSTVEFKSDTTITVMKLHKIGKTD